MDKLKTIGILGSGNYAAAIAQRLARTGYNVVLGSRRPTEASVLVESDLYLDKIRVTSITECIITNTVIIVALHVEHFDSVFVPQIASLCSGKILVDVSNRESRDVKTSNANLLASYIPEGKIVKALNTLSAYILENDAAGGSKAVPVASDDDTAREVVCKLVQEMGFEAYGNGGLRNAWAMEESVLVAFPEWRIPTIIAVIVILFWTVFVVVKFYFLTDTPWAWDQLPLKAWNKAIASSTITLLALVYLPGLVAAVVQVYNGTKHKRFPTWLDIWMKTRKQLGLWAFMLLVVHAIMSVLTLNPAYHKTWFVTPQVTVPHNRTTYITVDVTGGWMKWYAELALLFGVLAFLLMGLLAVSSLPSVTNSLNWGEWRLVQSQMGYVMLTIAVLHIYVMAFPRWLSHPFIEVLYSGRFWSLLIPTLIITIRLILLMPCCAQYIDRIRKGWERPSSHDLSTNAETMFMSKRNSSPKSILKSSDSPIENGNPEDVIITGITFKE